MESGTYPSPFAGQYPSYCGHTVRLLRLPHSSDNTLPSSAQKYTRVESGNIPNSQHLEEWMGTCPTVISYGSSCTDIRVTKSALLKEARKYRGSGYVVRQALFFFLPRLQLNGCHGYN